MLWDQLTKIYTDHINPVQDTIGMSSDRLYRWRQILEEYDPEILCIIGIDNTVVDTIFHFRYNPNQTVKDYT